MYAYTYMMPNIYFFLRFGHNIKKIINMYF
jgi:hypothetical protein